MNSYSPTSIKMEDDITRQADEIESLSSIYDKEWKTENEASRTYSMSITDSVILCVTLPTNYPSEAPPVYRLSAPQLSHDEKLHISRLLDETYLENVGETVVFQWIEAVRTYLNERSELYSSLSTLSIEHDDNTEVHEQQEDEGTTVKEDSDRIKITHGEIIVDRKSTFQGHVATVSSLVDVKSVLKLLLANKKIENATHNIYAYRILKGENCMLQDYEDDGETQAGKRLLHLLQIMNLTNVVVVVSRWYGGIHLGPDRFRHISNAARGVLVAAGFEKKK